MASSRPFSARLNVAVADRLQRRGQRAGLSRSRLAERYIDEGMRMDDHPGVVFRDGPAGRRAALARGPDVWEVIGALRASGSSGAEAIDATARWADLTPAEIRTAVRYFSEFPDEIEERIRSNLETADAAEAAWRREQATLR